MDKRGVVTHYQTRRRLHFTIQTQCCKMRMTLEVFFHAFLSFCICHQRGVSSSSVFNRNCQPQQLRKEVIVTSYKRGYNFLISAFEKRHSPFSVQLRNFLSHKVGKLTFLALNLFLTTIVISKVYSKKWELFRKLSKSSISNYTR